MTPLERLEAVISGLPSAVVALSGGVDSAVVAAVAHRVLGARALAVTSASASVSALELADARRVAAETGVAHRVIVTREIENLAYVANNPDRCYHCKGALYDDLRAVAAETGFAAILNGTNQDDLGDVRPGLKAAEERDVRSPLLEAGLGKVEVRAIARELGLSAAERPANACLASRLPHGTAVTRERLAQVEQAEAAMHDLGFRGHRVRHHGDLGRIEVPEGQFDLAVAMRRQLTACLREAGYAQAVLDLEGYRPAGQQARAAQATAAVPLVSLPVAGDGN